MTIIFRARSNLLDAVRSELHRPHPYAAERVGWLVCRAGRLTDGGLVILASEYDAVADGDYVKAPNVGAMPQRPRYRRAAGLSESPRVPSGATSGWREVGGNAYWLSSRCFYCIVNGCLAVIGKTNLLRSRRGAAPWLALLGGWTPLNLRRRVRSRRDTIR
jgi:hypothetical protein